MSSVKFAFRTLFKTPFVTVIAIVSLALGIGANAAIFSCFNQMLLESLTVPQPAQLVNLAAPEPKPGSTSCGQAGDCDAVVSYAMFRDLQKVQTVFTGIAAHLLFGANLSYQGQTLNGQGLMVSGNYFQVLQLQPALGRLFDSNDDRLVGEAPVVVLSHAYWTTRFAADPNVLNQGLIVNGRTLTIVGVAPRDFDSTTLGAKPQVFVPITLKGQMQPGWRSWNDRTVYWAYLFARLRPGVSIETARGALNAQYHAIINDVEAPLQKDISEATLAKFRAKPIVVEPGGHGQSQVRSGAQTPLYLLLSVTGFVLLIACANIANLLLARSAARANEMAIRLAIGASRARLMGQLLTESLLLALLGGIAGIFVAHWTLALIMALLPAEIARTLAFAVSTPALLFAALLTVGTGLLFGLFPAIHSTRPDLVSTLKAQAGQPSGARGAARFRLGLATAQIALSMLLLAASGFFVKSLLNVSRVDLGIKVDNVLAFGLSPDLSGYTPERARLLFERLEAELRATPGVTAATTSTVPILSGSNWGNSVAVQGFPAGPDTNTGSRFNEVGPGYFSTMGIPLMAGREFIAADTVGSQKVAIVNEEFVKKFNLGRDAVGKLMGTGSGYRSKLDTVIVGVVQNAKYSEVKRQIPPLFFRPYRQDARFDSGTLYVRTNGDPAQMASAVTAVVKRIDPNLPIENLKTLKQQVRDNTFLDHMMTTLSSLFAGLATLLAAVGLYGVLAYTISQRTREIGLRMALGAAPSRVRTMVLRQVAWMTLVGGVVGLAGAVAIGKSAGSLLFDLRPWDPAVLTISAVLLSIVAISAGFIPAYRASQVDPMLALRDQ
ncbi:MAG TPA: ABC transporter permease [Vicinamibacterales bacterium]|nr:ABC transporter permease [Vicinamibacterales bacterium]